MSRFARASLALLLPLAACATDEGTGEDILDAEGDGDGDVDTGSEGAESMLGDAPDDSQEPPPCNYFGESQTCTGPHGQGTQFCIGSAGTFTWGECLTNPQCLPGNKWTCPDNANISVYCELGPDGVPFYPIVDCDPTPLVLSFDGGPIELATSAEAFDISGTGMCLGTDWPAARTPWLAIDLDRNGHVDGGHELFGSASVLASGGRAQNGFIALEALDSNLDGKIDRDDERFDDLLVWRDEDGDKRSLPWELTSLVDEGVRSISLDYVVREECDARANCGRERSSFEFVVGRERRVGEVVDLHLACQ